MTADTLSARVIVIFLVYWAMQAIAAVLFKYGSLYADYWWHFFVAGQVFGAGSIVFMMYLYGRMHPNIALGICVGGAFLTAQVTTAVVFQSALTPLQWMGMLAITAGMLALALGSEPEPTPTVTGTIAPPDTPSEM